MYVRMLSALLLFSVCTFSGTLIEEQNDKFIRKHKIQKIAGFVLSVVGCVGLVSSIPFYNNALQKNSAITDSDRSSKVMFGSAFVSTGFICNGISIPFYISSRKNKDKVRLGLSAEINRMSLSLHFF